MQSHELSVTGMSCKSCERIVEQELTALAGVATVSADSGSGIVTVEGDEESLGAATEAIDDIGYAVEQ